MLPVHYDFHEQGAQSLMELLSIHNRGLRQRAQLFKLKGNPPRSVFGLKSR